MVIVARSKTAGGDGGETVELRSTDSRRRLSPPEHLKIPT